MASTGKDSLAFFVTFRLEQLKSQKWLFSRKKKLHSSFDVIISYPSNNFRTFRSSSFTGLVRHHNHSKLAHLVIASDNFLQLAILALQGSEYHTFTDCFPRIQHRKWKSWVRVQFHQLKFTARYPYLFCFCFETIWLFIVSCFFFLFLIQVSQHGRWKI